MPITVRGPDGKTIQFPDGTSPADMTAALDAHYGAAAQPPAPAAPEAPVENYAQLAQRLDSTQAGMNDFRQANPTAIEQKRIQEAQRLGFEHGQAQGPGSTFGREMTNTFGLGLPNLLEAATSGIGTSLSTPENHEFIKAADQGRYDANPKSSLAGTGAGIAAQVVTAPVSAAKTVLGRFGQAVAGGALTGGTQAAIDSRGDPVETLHGTETGAAGGAIGGALGERVGQMAANRALRKGVEKMAPSIENLGEMSKRAYKAAEDSGVHYSQGAFQTMTGDLGAKLAKAGSDPTLTGDSVAAFQQIADVAKRGGDVPISELDRLRKIAQIAADSQKPADARLGAMIIDHIDNFVDGATDAGAVTAGKGTDAAAAYNRARETWAAMRRGELLDKAIADGAANAEVSGKGANAQNTIKQAFNRILKDKRLRRGFGPEEIAAMKAVLSSGNVSRFLGQAAPTGIVSSGISSTMGASIGSLLGPVGTVAGAGALPAMGEVFRRLGIRSTSKAADYAAALAKVPKSEKDALLAAIRAKKGAMNADEFKMFMALSGGRAAGSVLERDRARRR